MDWETLEGGGGNLVMVEILVKEEAMVVEFVAVEVVVEVVMEV